MQIYFRLAQILQKHNQRGIVKRICEKTQLERHTVSAILRNKAKYLSLSALAKLCDYLVENHQIDPQQLPGILFVREPGDFWTLVGGRRYLAVCIGVRRDPKAFERRWVIASDAYLHGALLHKLSELSSTPGREPLRPEFLEQRLVSAYGKTADLETMKKEAELVYGQFDARDDDRAWICVGSVKSNILCEMVLARGWNTPPFTTQDDVRHPQDRRCPIFIRYRSKDPQPPSCCGGLRLARSQDSEQPGIYYENSDRTWSCCPWEKERHDAAVVYYVHRPTLGRLEMVLGGFSGDATRWLAAMLGRPEISFWPPGYSAEELQVGAFIVKFDVGKAKHKPSTRLNGVPDEDVPPYEIVPLNKDVLKRRLES